MCISIFSFLAEDDPDDADFEPDGGVTSGRTGNKVILFNILCFIHFCATFLKYLT